MKKSFCLVLVLTLQVGPYFAEAEPDLFIGAGGAGFGCGSNSPAVQRPYSFVRLGPDTTPLIKKEYIEAHHFGGYSTMDHAIRAISHMHLVGAGVIDLGTLGVLPIKSQTVKIPKDPEIVLYKTTEYAEPGYYKSSVQNDIDIELTTTQRAGLHRYRFNSKGTHQILIMSSYLLQKKAKRHSVTSKCGSNCLEGDIFINGGFGSRFGGYHIFYHLQWLLHEGDSVKVHLYNDTDISDSETTANGNFSGAILETNASQIQLRVGLSYVSVKNARQNMKQEIPEGSSFEDILSQSKQQWNSQLSRFQMTAISEAHQTKLDTAIYRSLLTPTLFSDWNGEYLSFSLNGSTMQTPENMGGVYTDMSLWDVHRTHFPWMLLHDQQRLSDVARSLMLINQEGGYMPKWPFANGHTGCMIGAHANTILADWFVKTYSSGTQSPSQATKTDIDSEEAERMLGYMIRNANTNTKYDSRSDPQRYLNKGYMSVEQRGRSASCSETLELSYNDFSISQVASILGQESVSQEFIRRSKFYRNVWNPKTKFFEPKFDNGSFVELSAFDRLNFFSNHYTEGDAWQYRFYAPHDRQGLVELFGGGKQFVKQLQILFKRSFLWPTLWLPNPYYWAGNEHNLLSVWQFNFANRSDLTQKYSRKIIDTQYGLTGSGLPGNDDYGTMSAWLIFASLGFYPIPSTLEYALGSPTIHSARIIRKMSDGHKLALNINVKGNSPNKTQVSSISINGELRANFINHTDFSRQNSVLNFVL